MSAYNPVKKMTLCWDCAKACGGCSWSDHFEHSPVPGWEAEETHLRLDNNGNGTSYIVLSCPEFERDGANHGVYRYKNGEIYDPWTGKQICSLKNCKKQG